MSEKGCDHHGSSRRKWFRQIFAGILIFAFIILLTVLITWAVLKPTKPKFILQDATVYNFNLSSPNLLSSTFQVTLSSRNPNDKIGVYYDKLAVYATYRSQQITLRTVIQPTYQGHKQINVWSPYIYGTSVSVAPYNAVALAQDQAAGGVIVTFKVDGRVRFKVGTFVSGKYHLYVECLANIRLGNRAAGVVVGGNAVKYSLVEKCSVSV